MRDPPDMGDGVHVHPHLASQSDIGGVMPVGWALMSSGSISTIHGVAGKQGGLCVQDNHHDTIPNPTSLSKW